MDDGFALPADTEVMGVEAPAAVFADLASRPAITHRVTRGAARLLTGLGFAPVAEVPLPNGRRADLMALGAKGEIVIVEVKSGLADYRADGKWVHYGPYCDRFFFAVDPDFPRAHLPPGPGLIVADGFGGMVAVEAPTAALAPARRKALTLHLARLAAWRALAG